MQSASKFTTQGCYLVACPERWLRISQLFAFQSNDTQSCHLLEQTTGAIYLNIVTVVVISITVFFAITRRRALKRRRGSLGGAYDEQGILHVHGVDPLRKLQLRHGGRLLAVPPRQGDAAAPDPQTNNININHHNDDNNNNNHNGETSHTTARKPLLILWIRQDRCRSFYASPPLGGGGGGRGGGRGGGGI